MANTRLTSTIITKEFLAVLHSSLHLGVNIDHSWNALFGKSFGPASRAGRTVSIRKPALGTVRSTWAMNQSDVTERKVDLTIDQIRGVDLNFSDAELSLDIEDFSKRYIVPNAQLLASSIEAYLATYMIQNTAQVVGTPGTSPNASSIFLDARRKLAESLAPDGGRKITVIEPQTEATMVAALAGQYNPQPFISTMFEKGIMPSSNALGLEWYMSQVVPAFTCGSRVATAGSTQVNASTAPTNGATSLVDAIATTGKTYVVGDSFTIVGVYGVNAETKTSTGVLKEFRVTTAATAASSKVTLVFDPPMYDATAGADQNITALPATSANLTFYGTASTAYKQNLVFVPECCAIAFADLELPGGMDMASVVSSDGISLRFVRGYDIVNARMLSRMEAFFGASMLRPEWCVRVFGA